MRIISKRNGFKAPKYKKQQRLIGRIHNAGEYELDPKYSDQTVLNLSDIPGNLPNNPIEESPKN